MTGADVGALTPDRIAFDMGVNVPEWRARFGMRIQVAGDFERRDLDAASALEIVEVRDGYTVLDVYASWQPGFTDGLRFDAGVEYVFDKDYERVFAGVSEPGRNFKIAASWQFGR
ncbi:hypothetical protein [Hyphomonas sp.]|uniref:hypothetical protein n=1 Tax=Hyphomonas sp. TaxID=87 RepID=UPI003D28E55C